MSALAEDTTGAVAAPPPDLPPHVKKMAALRSHQLLEKYFPAIIAKGGSTRARADSLLAALTAIMEDYDRIGHGIDIRPDLGSLAEKIAS